MFNQLNIFATSHVFDISFKGSDQLSSIFDALHLRKQRFAGAIDCSCVMVSTRACALWSYRSRPVEGLELKECLLG